MPVGQVDAEEAAGAADDEAAGAVADETAADSARAPRAVDQLPALIPGVLMAIMSFRAGGYFPAATAVAAVAIAAALALHVALSKRPFAGLRLPYVLGAAALGLFALLTLASAAWSHAPARAIVEYDRALLYALLFVLLGAWGRRAESMRWMIRGIAAAAFVVCLCGLVTRLLPDVWAIAPAVADERLSYPLTYWNSLGLLAAVGFVLTFALTSDDREHQVGRVLGAAALPILASTIVLTFSRGAIAAVTVGLLALIILGRPRALLSALLVVVPTVALAIVATYAADLLAGEEPTTAAATAQGHNVALVIVICTALAALGRAALLAGEPSWMKPRLAALRGNRIAWSAGLAIAVVVAIAAGLPGAVGDSYERLAGDQPEGAVSEDNRSRLATPRDNGRFEYWRVALEDFAGQPLLGQGAGTYPLSWQRLGRASQFNDGHSLYVEVLGELGVVGFLLVVCAVLLVLGGLLARARAPGPDRVAGAALFAAGLAWALHAGIEWDWEMPAVTLWFFAAGGLALAADLSGGTRAGHRAARMTTTMRLAIGLGCAVLAVFPMRVYLSDGPLRDSTRAFARGDCATAVGRAQAAISALDVRPEPHLIVGYCDVRLGLQGEAVRAMQRAVQRDPENWEVHYGLALTRAAAGLDPRPAARTAGRLKPWDPLPAQALRLFDTDKAQNWRRRAAEANLPSG